MTRRIGYLLPDFPVLSETFVSAEVARLRRAGLDVVPIVLSRSARADVAMLDELRADGITPLYLLDDFPRRLLLLSVRFVVRHPVAAIRAAVSSLRMPTVNDASRLSRWLKVLACGALICRLDVDRLHSHWTLPTDVAWILHASTGTRFSFSAHAHDIYDDGAAYEDAGCQWGLGSRIAAASFVVTCTAHGAKFLRRHAADDRANVHLVYHGVDLAAFPQLARERPPLVLGIGRLVRYKRFDRLIDACATVAARGHHFRCVIVGDGSQRAALERQIDEQGLRGRVELAGAQSHDEVRRLMAAAAVFVFGGEQALGQYGLPNVLVEALAARTAAVSTSFPEVRELLDHGRNGIVVEDPAMLADALDLLLTDAALRQRLGAAGRRTVEERFDGGVTIRTLVRLLETAR